MTKELTTVSEIEDALNDLDLLKEAVAVLLVKEKKKLVVYNCYECGANGSWSIVDEDYE